MDRIDEIQKEIAQLFSANGIEDGLIHGTFKDYVRKRIEGKYAGHRPYVDKRVMFKGVKKLNKLMNELDNELNLILHA